jgi:HK97 gp10 family phage protein
MPANPVSVQVTGLKECQEALKELPKATARNVQIRVLLKRARPIVAYAKAMVPVRFGDLKNSIQATANRPHGQKAPATQAFAQVIAAGGSQLQAQAAARAAGPAPVEVFIGPGRHPQSSLQEFGTRHHPPQPYMRPAWDFGKRDAYTGIAKDLWDEIQKAAARRAANQAKRATTP